MTVAPERRTPSPGWGKRLRYRLEHFILRTAVRMVPLIPLGVVHGVANVLGTIGWMADVRGRCNGMENLRCAFGPQYSVAQRRRILRASYRVFARTFFDLFWSPHLKEKDWDRHFILECDSPAARAALEVNHSIFVTAHFGGFEWLSIAKALRFGGSMTIAQDFKNPPLTDIFRRLRSAGDRQEIIPQEGAMLRIFKHLKKGGSAAALVDLTVPPQQSAAVIRSFGLRASMSIFHCALAQRTGLPVVPIMATPAADGRWKVCVLEPLTIGKSDDLTEAAQRCWDIFEPIIRDAPQHWLWMYKHWRYLPRDTPRESYPVYAARNEAFDRLDHGTAG